MLYAPALCSNFFLPNKIVERERETETEREKGELFNCLTKLMGYNPFTKIQLCDYVLISLWP